MKHTLKVTLILIGIFLCAQIVGLFTLNQYFDVGEGGNVEYKNLPMNIERPEVEESYSWIYITIGILIGTGIMLLLIKYGKRYITKLWLFLAIFISLSIAFGAYIDKRLAIALAFGVALWRIIRSNPYVHNISEIFMYGGIAALFHEMLNIKFAGVLLLVISVYDMIAVWKLKHMITLANYQSNNNMFAGLSIPYSNNEAKESRINKKNNTNVKEWFNSIVSGFNLNRSNMKKKDKKNKGKVVVQKVKTAILGGGDIAFPLIFAGAVLKEYNMTYAIIISVCATIAAGMLLLFSKKEKFYPAMPFITAGCFVGYLIVFLVRNQFYL